jgi:hypothetical protein
MLKMCGVLIQKKSNDKVVVELKNVSEKSSCWFTNNDYLN